MYAVIFKARIRELDAEYSATAERMRRLAIGEYGCLEFNSCAEGEYEIAISYWDSLAQIQAWKRHPEHRAAQQKGKTRWYSEYQVQVVEILRQYEMD